MIRAFCGIVVCSLMFASCTQRVICPAYQSAFIYDKDALRKKYSYFNADSTPKILTASSKNKYLIGVPVSYKKKVRSLQTVEMKPINPVVPDSLKEGYNEEMDVSGVERNVNDSTAVIRIDTLAASAQDSVYVISKDRETRILKYNAMSRAYYVDTVGFNTEQDNYMWYLREHLVLPDVRIAKRKPDAESKKGEKEGTKEKGGFFKNLFKKKEKQTAPTSDSTQQLVAEEEDYGYDDFEGKTKDSTQVEPPAQDSPKTKKKKEKAVKPKKADKKKKDTPPVKKEEEDDGF